MQVAIESESLDPDAVLSYLRNRVSGSVVYLLTLQQPLTLKEMQGHPLRLRYLELLTGKEASPARLRKVVSRGVDAGLLVPLTTRREYYYFLDSDLAVRPPALGEDGPPAAVSREEGAIPAADDVALPPAHAQGTGTPIPLLRDPTTLLAWLDWLTAARRREILEALQEEGPLTRKELADQGAPVDLATARVALRCGVLKMEDDRLDFPFSRTRVTDDGRPWTARPPRFWLTRSYEPLRCVQGADAYLDDPAGRSPRTLLEEMEADGKKVVPSWRRGHLTTNFLYEPSAVVPALEEVGPATLPAVWENRRGWAFAAQGGWERAEAARVLEAELHDALPAGVDTAPELLSRLARRKVEAYLREREEALAQRFQEGRGRGYGLGPDALLTVASEEVERGHLQEERRHFQRFLEVLEG